jgi:MFS superfamily sulfate permease-like transporter
LAAFAGVVVLGTLKGILVAIIVSLVALAYQAANLRRYVLGRMPGAQVVCPRSDAHPEDETFPGLLMVRPEGRLFFANAQRIGERIWPLIDTAQPKVVAMDFSVVPDIEYSALKMLTEGEERLREPGDALWLAAPSPDVQAMLQRSSLGDILGRSRAHAVQSADGRRAIPHTERCRALTVMESAGTVETTTPEPRTSMKGADRR